MSGRRSVRVGLGALLLAGLLAGCEYGYSRGSLIAGDAYVPPPRSSVYGMYASPGFFSYGLSLSYAYPYYSYPYYYPYSYPYPYYYPYVFAPYYPHYYYPPIAIRPAPRRTLRLPPGTSSSGTSSQPSAPSAPSTGGSRRQLNLP